MYLNSFPPSATYASVNWVSIGSDNGLSPFRRQAIINQCWVTVNWTLRSKLPWNSNQDTEFSIHENAFENDVCEMVPILSRGRWVKQLNKQHFSKRPLTHYGLKSQYGIIWGLLSTLIEVTVCQVNISINVDFILIRPSGTSLYASLMNILIHRNHENASKVFVSNNYYFSQWKMS